MSKQTLIDALKGRMVSLDGKVNRIKAAAEREGRDFTEHEHKILDSLLEEFNDLESELALQEGREKPRRGPSFEPNPIQPQNRPHHQKPPALFGQTDDKKFQNFGDYLRTLNAAVRGRPDNRLQSAPRDAFEEKTGTGGGFLVPPKFVSEIFEDALTSSDLLDRVTKIPMPGGNLTIAGADTEDHSSGLAGISLQWLGESQEIDTQNPTVRSLNFRAKKAAVLVHCSNEILEDAPTGDQQLRSIFASALKLGLESVILSGNGAGRPLGILNSDSLVVVAKETSQVADTVVFENLIKMLSRLHPSMINDAIWICNTDTMPQLLQLAFKIQNVAGSENVGGQRIDVATDQAGRFRVLGLPVVFSESCPTLGDQGDVVLASPSQYVLGVTTQLSIDVSPHNRFAYDQTSYRMKIRVDGMSRWSSVITPAISSTTLAPFVTLAARA